MELSPAELISPRDQSPESCLSIYEVLSRISDLGSSTPRDIAQNRLRESVIRLHCNRLSRLNLIDQQASELYVITAAGREALAEGKDLEAAYSDYIRSIDEDLSRIKDLSELDSLTVKEVNLGLFEDSGQDYGLVRNQRHLTKRRIMNVKGHRLYRIFREFPRDEPLVSQCAHWMRTFAGIHFFPDANHRTGMLLLQVLLKTNEIDDTPMPGPYITRAVLRSKLIRILHMDSVTLRDLWKKDEYYTHWFRYFRDVLNNTRNGYDTDCSVAKLKRSLKEARGLDMI